MKFKEIYRSEKGKIELLGFYDKLLANFFQHAIHHLVPTSLGNTFVISSGNPDYPCLILLHGTGSNSAMWLNEIRQLSQNFHVMAIDIPGECGKSSSKRPSFLEDHYANWLNDLFLYFKMENAVLAGYSLGGWLCIDFALQFPEKVKKLVLFAPAGIVQVKPKTIFWIIISSFMGKVGFNKLNKIVYGNQNLDRTTLQFTELIRKYFIPRTDVLPLFNKEQLGKLISPVVFYGGSLDCFYDSTKAAHRLEKEVPNSKNHVIEGEGHILRDLSNRILKAIN